MRDYSLFEKKTKTEKLLKKYKLDLNKKTGEIQCGGENYQTKNVRTPNVLAWIEIIKERKELVVLISRGTKQEVKKAYEKKIVDFENQSFIQIIDEIITLLAKEIEFEKIEIHCSVYPKKDFVQSEYEKVRTNHYAKRL